MTLGTVEDLYSIASASQVHNMPEKSSRAQTGLVDWEEGKKEGRPLKNSLPRENYQDWRLVVFQLF